MISSLMRIFLFGVGQNGQRVRSTSAAQARRLSAHSRSENRKHQARKQKNREKDFLQRNIEVWWFHVYCW